MFTAGQMQLIRAHCLSEFESLLRKLSIPADWSGDEYQAYDRIDGELTKKISALMKNSSVTSGYKSLLKLGGMPYDYSETDSEILGKIVANKNLILRGLEKSVEPVTIDVSPEIQQPPIQTQVIQQTRLQTVTRDEHITLRGPIILGASLIVAGLAVMFVLGEKIGGAILATLGLISAIIGVGGKNTLSKIFPCLNPPISPCGKVYPFAKKKSRSSRRKNFKKFWTC